MLNRSWLGLLACSAITLVSAAPAQAQDIVLHTSDVAIVQGNWAAEASSSGAGGQRMTSADSGWSSADAALAAPRDYFEATFNAPSATTYHVWLRMRAAGDSKWNESVWVQFSDATDQGGSPLYRIGTTSALLVNLESCSGCGVSGWGWQDKAYWLQQTASIRFAAAGTHTVRVQTREDGAQVDQIVLSPANYLTRSPGQLTNDSTVLARSTGSGTSGTAAATAASSTASGSSSPYLGSAISLPGTVNAADFDNGGEGIAFYDTSPGNSGGAYRSTHVDLEASGDGGYNVGWTAAGEWLNYSVNVTTSGNYTVQLRVAAANGGGTIRVGFNKSNVWKPVSVGSTGGWQSWTTVNLPVTLTAGTQLLTVLFDTGGVNLSKIIVANGSGSSGSGGGGGGGAGAPASTTLSPFGGTARAIPGTIQAEDFDEGGQGVAYSDTTSGNSGGAYRNTNVDIEASAGGGYNVGWTAPSEYLNYTVNVGSAGNYTVQLRVASAPSATLRVGFNGPSNVWKAVPVSSTGGWQNWATVNVPVTLGAGKQVMTLLVESGGVNLDKATIVSGTSTPPPSPPPPPPTSNGTLRMMTWNVQHGSNITGQAQFIANHHPDVVALQEVQTWNENQPQRYKQLLEQYTGQSWTVVWAPVNSAAGTEGNVLLTRLPVVAQNTYQMHATSDWSAMYSNRSVAQATVRVGSVNVNVFSTHLDYYNTSHRSIQLQQLMSWALNFGGPRLVGGDFNSWWGEYWITTMMSQYTDTWQDYTGSNQNGYTVNNAVRFDYIFRSMDGNWRATPTNCYVPVTSLSDHNPVIADYRIQ